MDQNLEVFFGSIFEIMQLSKLHMAKQKLYLRYLSKWNSFYLKYIKIWMFAVTNPLKVFKIKSDIIISITVFLSHILKAKNEY